MALVVPDFESLVVPLRREQRSYFLMAFAIIALGVVVILAMVVAPIFSEVPKTPVNMIGVGAFGLSAMSALPIRNWMSARRRVDYIRHMESLWREYAGMPKPPKDELARLKELLWKLREQGALAS